MKPGKRATAIKVACIQAATTLLAASEGAVKGTVDAKDCAKLAAEFYREVMKVDWEPAHK